GYMYYEKANNDRNALMDFNRLNDRSYTYKTPVISVPVCTYDVFNISGEGTGGSFRGYRGNMGYMRDNNTKSKADNINVRFDLGLKDIAHIGATFGGVFSNTTVGEWIQNNGLRYNAAFKNTDSLFQSFYFKNPGEKAIIDEKYYHEVGDDQLIRPYLLNTGTATPYLASSFQVFDKNRRVDKTIPVDDTTFRRTRDKRTQVITFLTAKDADLVGLNKMIYSYKENTFRPGSCADTSVRTAFRRYDPSNNPLYYRKANHISEINVLEADGRQYIFDIPAYQIKQKEVTFAIDAATPDDYQRVGYTPGDQNSTENKKGRDGYYESETMNGYAHSFLLSGILSPDYVDITGDGITDDDLGTAVRFDYSRVDKQRNISNYWMPYKWRMPVAVNKANYNEGLKADALDDKGLYTYGEKELWYLHSIESKNMVATFRISERNDGKPVIDENGGVSSGPGQKKLDRIDVYTKADYLKSGSSARPIKSVFFKYSYKLCKNYDLNTNTYENSGKLTLDSLWFTYNGNDRQKKNKYVFKYSITNPDYNSSQNDRWGTYKPSRENPADAANSDHPAANNDYPYTLQNKDSSDIYASAWSLQSVLLPSGAVIRVQYEADDYAFVQDRRASQMTTIKGFGLNATSTPSNKLYTGLDEHRFVFFDVTDPIADNTELGVKYMQNFNQLLMKLLVLMPAGNIGTSAAYQPVTIYGAIHSYGLVPTGGGSYNHNRFYIEISPAANGGSPIFQTVLQFLRDYLPARAYPGYEVKGDGALLQIIRSVWGMVIALQQGVLGFAKAIKLNGQSRSVDLDLSFARLNNPEWKKIGGGHRVKSVVISDNWSKMTKRNDMTGLPDSYYGQVYDYTKTEEINGEKRTISSGVATYEPGVGNEENPFREVLKYSETQPLGPTQIENIELPVAETFFPSSMVGYSRVTVKSIHNKDTANYKSGVGMQETEFYTSRDFPVISDFTGFDPQSRHQYKPTFLSKVFNINKRDYMTLTQGFRVSMNDMNGKMKSQTSFPENDLVNAINRTSYYYRLIDYGENKHKLDNILPVISGPDGKITDKLIGKEVEVMNDFREHLTSTIASNIPVNLDIFKIGIIPILIPTVFRLKFRNESRFRSASTLKVINEFGILDSVVNVDKGSMVSTKNLVYDAESGDVLVSRTNNEFDKPVYQFNYPAWWVNTGMEPAYRNVDLTYKNVLFRNGRIEESPQVNMNNFESGDEIYVMDMATKGPAESPGCVLGGYPVYLPMSDQYKIWAVDVRKDLRNKEKDFVFLDRFGVPYNAANATIRVIRSGKRNLSGASVGSIVSLTSPIRIRGGRQQIILDDTTDVLNAGAMEFKERWRANDQFYAVDTLLVTTKQTPIRTVTIAPIQAYSRERNSHNHFQNINFSTPLLNKVFEIEKRRKLIVHSAINHEKWWSDQNSWIRFSLPSQLAGGIVTNAVLGMHSHDSIHAAPGMG
ncbi:MAG: hypothetical protein ABI480_15740, partial [Chitinophagaceae bacterium]